MRIRIRNPGIGKQLTSLWQSTQGKRQFYKHSVATGDYLKGDPIS